MLGDVVDPLAPVQPTLQWVLTEVPAIVIASLSAIALGAATAANALTRKGRPDSSHRVIVSAHSLGAVLAVAAVLSRGASTAEHTNAIGLAA